MRGLIFKIAIFAIAFAFVESSVVVYLRHLLGVSFIPFFLAFRIYEYR